MSFEVIPAVDLADGQVVQLEQGDPDRRTVFGDDPVAVAKRWVAAGASRLHVVDLSGAIGGTARHRDEAHAVIAAVDVPVQVAGGIRDLDTARAWLEAGADRVVIGTAAVSDEAFCRKAADELGEALVVALDVRGREVQVAGWTSSSGRDVVEVARAMVEAGVSRVLCTDVGRDGMLTGPNVELMREVVGAGMAVIASGGVSSVADVAAVAACEGVEGVVIGTALYRGDIDLAEAMAVA